MRLLRRFLVPLIAVAGLLFAESSPAHADHSVKLVASAAHLTATQAPHSFNPTCSATLLPLPDGALGGEPAGTDGNGIYVGHFAAQDGSAHGALWRDGVFTDLGTGFLPWTLNRRGVIVGVSVGADGSGRAAVLRDGVVSPLPEPPGATGSFTRGIDDTGDIVGGAVFADFTQQAVVWPADSPGSLVPLSTPEDTFAQATGIDRKGLISGSVTPRFGQERAMVWRPDGSILHALQTLDPNAGQQTGLAIVDGRVAGFEFASDFVSVPVEWDKDGVATPLPSSGDAIARALNRSGVVGGDQASQPVMWLDGEQVQLPLPAGMSFGFVLAVGDDGTMAGSGDTSENVFPVLWDCAG